jgi:cysteine desulfurase/selenocysteine lyase
MNLDIIKSRFPVFRHNPSLVYVDNASTTQKPIEVIKSVSDFYEYGCANVHRGLYKLSEEATVRYERVRREVAEFIGAKDVRSIAFTKGTTESINIVAQCYLHPILKQGDEVVISAMEHHANLIPWQQVCKQRKAVLKVLPVDGNGDLIMDEFHSLVGHRTKLVAVTLISNTLGTINPVKEIIQQAHHNNVPVLVDAAQSVSHYPIKVDELDADFLVFSGHKMFGPMGVGVLYSKEEYWEGITPLIFGGGAIRNVEFDNTEFMDYPRSMEAGTPNVSGVLGLGAAINFIKQLDLNQVPVHIENLAKGLRSGLNAQGFKVIGNARNKSGIVSFIHDKIHPHDIASYLASQNVAVRAGHHCTQPLLHSLGVASTVRASFSVYNTNEDVDRILDALQGMKKFWS